MAKRQAVVRREPDPPAQEPEIVSPDVQLVTQAGSAIQQWVGNARLFFKQAQAMELTAKAYLVRAEGLKTPETGDQDAQLQDLIRIGNSGKKEIADFWTITSALDRLHKWAVQGRKRGVDAYEQGTTHLNRLHVQYVDTERRRAQAEEDRLRREAEQRAQDQRAAELRLLEEQALKAEANSPDLSEREQMFVQLVSSGSGSFDAAKRSGYKDPGVMGPRLLSSAKIVAAIEAIRIAQQARQQAQAIKAAPVEIEEALVEVRPDVRGGDRTTWKGEIVDEKACIDAAWSGTHGIPRDLFQINQAMLTKYAQSMHSQMDRWPGVRAVKTTKVV